MKYIPLKTAVLVMSILATSAHAQDTTNSDAGNTPAVSTQDANNPGAPVEGENSFTEDQARQRMEDAGYTGIKDLKLDDKGFWNASGMKGQTAVQLVLDYQGNVVAR